MASTTDWLRLGSSPRSRGTRGAWFAWCSSLRFIPALAGNTPPAACRCPSSPVHPRARGEHQAPNHLQRCPGGSSPRSRGTPSQGQAVQRLVRFIPALAGNTTTSCPVRAGMTVHPRARGEHIVSRDLLHDKYGSSPRSRGTLEAGHSAHAHLRFIPALAGNTYPPVEKAHSSSVHPRARGEHLRRHAGRHMRRRFIPALAGNTPRRCPRRRGAPVHPRARGEHWPLRSGQGRPSGSSPRSRGTRGQAHFHPRHRRFIPALAGNTSGPS